MIHFERSGPIPGELRKTKVKNHLNALRALVRARKLNSKSFRPYWQDYDLRETLWKLQHKKCAFTERHRHWKLEMDVEHYRPKAAVDEDLSHPGYWWLAYDWDNYLLCNKHANTLHKGNHFPLLSDGQRARSSRHALEKELPKLLNPFVDHPEQCFEYRIETVNDECWVYMDGTDLDGRGGATEQILNLNEYHLAQERGELVDGLQAIAAEMTNAIASGDSTIISNVRAKIRRETTSKMAFAGFRRWFFRNEGLGAYVASS